MPFSVNFLYYYTTNNVSFLSQCRNDIAILWLASSASLNSAVKVAILPASGSTLAHNYNCVVTGWGRISSKFYLYNIFQTVSCAK